MRPSAFAAPLGLHQNGPCRKRLHLQLSHQSKQPVCLTNPPPPTPKSKRTTSKPTLSKRNRSPQARGNHREEVTASELSDRLSRAVGFDLVLEDLSRVTDFFRSFVKSKPSSPIPAEQQTNQPPFDSPPETDITLRTQSQPYTPKSVTAAKIAETYAVTRGIVERALQQISISASSYISAGTRIAGDTVCSVLSVGHQAFPGLRLDRTRDVVLGALNEGWNPLSAFHWQLGPGPERNLEERRLERRQQIASLLRGGVLDALLNTTGSALTGLGNTVEKLAPVVFKGVQRVTSGYVKSANPQSIPQASPQKKAALSQRRGQASLARKRAPRAGSSKPSLTPWYNLPTKAAEHPLEAARSFIADVPSLANQTGTTRADFAAFPFDTRDEIERRPDNSSDQTETESGANKNKSELLTQASKTVESSLARNGTMVLAAGALATVAAGVSVPTAVTCSALMVISVAFSGAKAANGMEVDISARHRGRYSRSVQHMEEAVVQAYWSTSFEKEKQTQLLAPAGRSARRRRKFLGEPTNDLAGSDERKQADPHIIEASAYTVSGSLPRVLSVPFVGVFLNWMDIIVFRVEKLVCIVLRRSGMHVRYKEENDWDLLGSFQRSSHLG